MKIYLDTCCINRPFDDQSQDRVRLEAESILLIIRHFENQEWMWYGSDVLTYEIEQIPDAERWQRVRRLANFVHTVIDLDENVLARAKELEGIGFKAYDALHIASAEQAEADVLLTTDDRLLRLAERHAKQVKVRLYNPLLWLNEVTKR